MAELRVRLQFDYPPPAGPESRRMWMLLNSEHLRTVTDLSDLIRARYYPNLRGALCLYVHDCLLPPAESARLIRDNDVIRVQWNGHDPEDDGMDSDSQDQPSKKRSRQSCEEEAEDSHTTIPKRRKRDPQLQETPRGRKVDVEETEPSTRSSRKKAKKKKKVPAESWESKRSSRHSEESTSLLAAQKLQTLLRPKHKSPSKRSPASSSSDCSPHQESSNIVMMPSEISIQPITTIPLTKPSELTLRLFAAVSGKDSGISVENIGTLSVNKSSETSLNPIITFSSKKISNDSPEPSNTGKKPSIVSDEAIPRRPAKSRSHRPLIARNEPNHKRFSSSDSEPCTKSHTKGRKPPNEDRTTSSVNKPNHEVSSSDSSTSSTAGKKPSKMIAKAGASNSNHEPLGERATDCPVSSQELSEATRNNPRKEMTASTDIPSPMNGTAQEPHKAIRSPGSASGIGQKSEERRSRAGHEADGVRQGFVPNVDLCGRGRGRGRDFFPWRGQRGRGSGGRGDQGKGRGYGSQFFHHYGSPTRKKQHLEEAVTNMSVIIQNPPESQKKDYDALPLLAAPPQVGKVIVFKILELNENYSPELSDYKEGVVRSYDSETQQIEVEILSAQKRREPGKFDLVYEMDDGKEMVEYSLFPDCKIVEPWSSLVTPRLVIERGPDELTSAPPPL